MLYSGVWHSHVQFVPIVVMVVLTLTLIEAAGAAEYRWGESGWYSCSYLVRKLPGIDQRQQMSAKIMQKSNLIIMPNVFVRCLSISFYSTFLSKCSKIPRNKKNTSLYPTALFLARCQPTRRTSPSTEHLLYQTESAVLVSSFSIALEMNRYNNTH